MSPPKPAAAQRLERLQTVFAARRARLAANVARPPSPAAGARPLARLQHHGYSVALMMVLTAALPTVVGFAFRRRKLLVSAMSAGLRLKKLRTRLESAPATGRRR